MCVKIKSNFAVCHIPVVLLTAQTALDSTIESLKLGADDYITKPFEIPILLARCNNLVNGRKRLQERFAASPALNSGAIASNQMDREFLEKASRVIEENMENPEFGINEFSREMNLGRTSLFNKIKGVTGQTPNDFITTMKMKKATFLLSNQMCIRDSLCTEGDGLIAYNTRDKTYHDVPGLRNVNIKSAYHDKADNKLYLGLHLEGVRILDLTTQKVKEFPDIRPELDQSNICLLYTSRCV